MTESGMNQAPQSPIESVLADELARGDVVLGTAGPMLGLLLANYGHGLFSDAVVARVRGMELPLDELPRTLFDHVLATWRGQADGTDENAIEQASQRLRDGHAERARRLDLLAKAAAAVTGGGQPLAIGHFGVALFLSALAEQSGQEREIVALATDESQVGRLALALRAAGLKHDQVAEQFLLVHPEITLPDAFDTLRADRAATLLAGSGRKELG